MDSFTVDEKGVLRSDNAEEIRDKAFLERTDIIKIPRDGLPRVTRIGHFAFFGCNKLKWVHMAELKTLGRFAFSQCKVLRNVYVRQLTEMGEGAFAGSGIVQTEFLVLTTIPAGAFQHCENLGRIRIQEVTTIMERAFADCRELGRVEAPNLVHIGKSAFRDCTLLRGVHLPEVVRIEEDAFRSSGLAGEVTLPKLEFLGRGAFAECNYLRKINLPNLTACQGQVFWGCSDGLIINLGTRTGFSRLPRLIFANLTEDPGWVVKYQRDVNGYMFDVCYTWNPLFITEEQVEFVARVQFMTGDIFDVRIGTRHPDLRTAIMNSEKIMTHDPSLRNGHWQVAFFDSDNQVETLSFDDFFQRAQENRPIEVSIFYTDPPAQASFIDLCF